MLLCAIAAVGCFGERDIRTRPTSQLVSNPNKTSMFYNFKLKSLDGSETIDFSRYKGKKVIILNVASKCGYTPQYADWQAFYEKNKDHVEVLGFPSNEFLGQEPGNNAQINEFCKKNYGVTFQMFEKTTVKGNDKSELYTWLTTKDQNGWNEKEPSWNFCKYVINENGELTNFFSSEIKPEDVDFIAAIKKQ
jgi:glutathione peroxidase